MRAHLIVIALLSTTACPTPNMESTEPKVTAPKPKIVRRPTIQRAPPNAKPPAKIANRLLRGKINGEKWLFVAGKATKVGNKLTIALYDQPLEGCGEPGNPNAASILLPGQNLTPGKGEFSFKIMAGFKYRAGSAQKDFAVFAVKGKWRIDSVGPKTVSGGFSVDYKNHFMNGKFTVPLCE